MKRLRRIGIAAAVAGGLALCALVVARHVDAQSGLLTVTTPTDVTCDGSRHPLSATSVTARLLLIIPAASGNAAAIRIGDASIGASRGWPIAGGGGLMIPAAPIDSRESTREHFYDLSQVFYFCTTSDKFSWGYVK